METLRFWMAEIAGAHRLQASDDAGLWERVAMRAETQPEAGPLEDWPAAVHEAWAQALVGERPAVLEALEAGGREGIGALGMVQGVGPARARQLAEEAGVVTIAGLLAPSARDRLVALKGIGPTRVDAMIESARAVAQRAQAVDALAAELRRRSAGAPVIPLRRATFEGILRDPETGGTHFVVTARDAHTRDGEVSWPVREGVVFALEEEPSPPGLAQRLMETPFYAKGYEAWFRPALTRLGTRQTLPQAIALSVEWLALDKGDAVLDVACGTGNFSRALARALDPEAGFVVGLDLSTPMLRRAALERTREGLAHLHFVRGDAHALPFIEGAFDAANLTGAFHLLPDPARALAELRRVVRPGGRLVVGTFVTSALAPVAALQQGFEALTAFRFQTPSGLTRLLRDAGWAEEVMEIDGWAATVAATAT